MTDREKAIVMAHTGICMLAGNKFQVFHKYVEDIMGRPIWTHDIGWLKDEIKEKSKADFMALCEDESGSDYQQGYDTANKEWLERLNNIRAEIKDWQTDIHDNEYDAESHDFVFERIYEIIDEYKNKENEE